MDKYQKLRIGVRYRLFGAASVDKRFQVALDAFDFCETLFEGKLRKDGLTPVFMHPLEIVGYLFTVQSGLRHPAETLAAAMLHDTAEDCGVSIERVRDRFGPAVAHATLRMSKTIGGISIGTLEEYFDRMLDCPLTTVLKGADRINNQGTMIGVFTPAKQLEYVDESEKYILPMLKKARRLFSDQEPVYENIKLVLLNQVTLVRAIHENPKPAA